MPRLLQRITILVIMATALIVSGGCQTPSPSRYAEFEKPLVCIVSRSDTNGRSVEELGAEMACRITYTVGLDMQGDPAQRIDGWLRRSETFFVGRVVLFTDRAVELAAVQSADSGGDVTISVRFPWAVDQAAWLGAARWRNLGEVSGNLVAAWPAIARDTAASAPIGGRSLEDAMRKPYGFMNRGYCGTGYDEFRTEQFAAAR